MATDVGYSKCKKTVPVMKNYSLIETLGLCCYVAATAQALNEC